jgi:hypothetical protein
MRQRCKYDSQIGSAMTNFSSYHVKSINYDNSGSCRYHFSSEQNRLIRFLDEYRWRDLPRLSPRTELERLLTQLCGELRGHTSSCQSPLLLFYLSEYSSCYITPVLIIGEQEIHSVKKTWEEGSSSNWVGLSLSSSTELA